MGIERQLNDYIGTNATGENIHIPKWGCFLILASRVGMGSLFLAPASLLVLATLVLPGDQSIATRFVHSITIAFCWLFISTGLVTRQMSVDGVLTQYLSLLSSTTAIGRFVLRKFGKTLNTRK